MEIERKLVYSISEDLVESEYDDEDEVNQLIVRTTITGEGCSEIVTLPNGKEIRVYVKKDISTVID